MKISNEADLEARRAALRDSNIAQLSAPKPAAPLAAIPGEKKTGRQGSAWLGESWEAFKTLAILFSFVMNLVLLIVVVLLSRLIFDLKNAVAAPLVGGLHTSFVEMDEAHIRTLIQVNDTIQVDDKIPVVFDLPVNTDTVVLLTQNTVVPNTSVFLNGVPIQTDIILPQGTPLGIHLDVTVPVSQTVPVLLTVPVSLSVPVDIALNQTDLHRPFMRLQTTVGPYNTFIGELPDTWPEALCRYAGLCFF